MKKHRIVMTVVLEIEADPEHYEGLNTDEERLACDIEHLSDWPPEMLENDACQVTFTGEVIENTDCL